MRGELTDADVARTRASMTFQHIKCASASDRGERLTSSSSWPRGRTAIRRLGEAVGHEVTALKRVAFGGLEIADLAVGAWREVTRAEVRRAFGPVPGWGQRKPVVRGPRSAARSPAADRGPAI